MERIRIEQHGIVGGIWIGVWLFTVGYLHLGLVQGVFALILWPYYLGLHWSAF